MARTRQVGISRLRASLRQVIEACRADGEACVVTSRGRPIALLAALDSRPDPAVGPDPAGVQYEAAPPGSLDALDEEMDSATWGQWAEMSEEDRAAMVMARSLIRGGKGPRGSRGTPRGGWGALAGPDPRGRGVP